MKIEKLIIFGFGKHQDRKIDVGPELSIFYGTNEAGKTTIQQFIIQILFGFPAKNQNLRRYEPKSGGKYGGQIHIQDPHFGRVVIERVKGKSAGDVTLYYEDGTRGSESDLKTILRDYDRASFESVFSFSIHELQGLEAMTEEELSRTLLASGTTGMDAIGKLESRLEKEMGEVFKKNGRNPQINQAVEELRMLEMELKEYRSRMDSYEPNLQRIREIDKRLTEIAQEEAEIGYEMKSLERWLQAAPLVEKRDVLQTEAAAIALEGFPADGRRRMDRLCDRLSETQSQITLMEKDGLPAATELPEIVDTQQLEQLMMDESAWYRLQSALQSTNEEMAKIADEQSRLLTLVGMELEEALSTDVSLSNEEILLAHIEAVDLAEEERRFQERKLAEEKAKLAEMERELKFFLAGEPSEQERATAEEWQKAAPKLAEAKAAGMLQKKQGSEKGNYLLIGLGVLGAAVGLFQTNFLLAILAVLAAAAGFWQLSTSRKQFMKNPEYEQVIAKYAGREAELEALLAKLEHYDLRLDGMLDLLEAAKRRLAQLSEQPQEEVNAEQAYRQFLQHLGIRPDTGRKTILDLFSTLREFHALHAASERLHKTREKLNAEVQAWVEKAESVYGRQLPIEGLYTTLRAEWEARKAQNEKITKQFEKARIHQEEQMELNSLASQIRQEQQVLLEQANAATIDEFYRLCGQWERFEEVKKELAPLEVQLKSIGSLEDIPDEVKTDAQNRGEQLEGILSELKNERHNLLSEQAEKLQTAKTLLSDGEYEDKLQQFEEKKEALADLASRWSVDKAIIEAIRQTLEELKEKKLPAVIKAAQTYFKTLTGQAYTGLELNSFGYFEAVREDGMRFHIAELSQATKEQAYISLRLSLVVSMKENHPFPVIMDDPFVHFDRRRLQHVINLITELQKQHQFIYFTCHDSMRQAWPKAAVIDVATIERSVHS